jgi:FMNH2-dependent dimethyl sulfone monooxygenase
VLHLCGERKVGTRAAYRWYVTHALHGNDMRLGVWTPLPHTIPPEPRMVDAIADARQQGAHAGEDKAFALARDVIQFADRNDFATTLIAARHLGPDLEAWTLAAALAPLTEKIELMVAVHPGIITPQMVAKMGASLDRISGGRFAANVVNGWNQPEFETFGNTQWSDTDEGRYRRMEEFIRVLIGLWRGENFTFKGEFYSCKDSSLPLKTVQRPNPPLYTASRSSDGKDVIAHYCDYWFVPDRNDYRLYDENLAQLTREIDTMRDRLSRQGRQIGFGLSAHVICADTVEEAHRRAEAIVAYGNLARYNRSAARGLGACLVGTKEIVAERIRAYEAIGVDTLMLAFSPMLEGIEAFVRDVKPLIAVKV